MRNDTTLPGQLRIGSLPGIPGTPFRRLWAAVNLQGIYCLDYNLSEEKFLAQVQRRFPDCSIMPADTAITALQQVREYCQGLRQAFTIPPILDTLTGFHQQVATQVMEIPYGQTSTYGEIAAQLGNPRAARAVGHANAVNPLPIVVPCHRLVGADGNLRGYGGDGGIETKKWLLAHESRHTQAG